MHPGCDHRRCLKPWRSYREPNLVEPELAVPCTNVARVCDGDRVEGRENLAEIGGEPGPRQDDRSVGVLTLPTDSACVDDEGDAGRLAAIQDLRHNGTKAVPHERI